MTQTTYNHMVGLIHQQLVDQFEIHEHDRQCIVVTPMLYPDNSRITVALEAIDDRHVLLTDNGEASGYAFVHGVPHHIVQDRIQETIRRYNLSDAGSDELMLTVEDAETAKGIFVLVSAIQDIGSLVMCQMSMHA